MDNKTKELFAVTAAKYGNYAERFETYEEAEACAREKSYGEGRTFLVFKAIAEAEQPVEVNTVKVNKL